MAFERINQFKLTKDALTYTYTSFVGNIRTIIDTVEYRKVSTLNNAYLTKKADFYAWDFYIFRNDQTDTEWQTIVDSLTQFNILVDIEFTPDTVDNPSDTVQVYFTAKEDLVNDYDVEKIFCQVIRVYSEGNEP